MRVLICFLTLMIPTFTHAAPSRVWWQQWKISSSEELYDDTKYSSYPPPLMLDGDTKTAWVYSAKNKAYDTSVFASRYGFVITPSTPITVDALRIMNGQNLSQTRFFGNHRFLKIRVTQNLSATKKVVTTATLADSMGWHNIKLPRHKIKSLKIELLDFKSGSSKNSDICISELELRNNDEKLNWRLPRAFMLWNGLEGCGASLLISRDGKTLDGIATEIGYEDEWNGNGRYVAGYAGSDEYVWIADAWLGKVVQKISFASNNETSEIFSLNYRWRNTQTLEIQERRENQKHRYLFLKAPNFK